MRTCLRCGDPFAILTVDQDHCVRCIREVEAIMAADARRRAPRFAVGNDLTPWPAKRVRRAA